MLVFARSGLMVLISSPSGAGKSTLAKKIVHSDSRSFVLSISATTRPPRPGEKHGQAYYFYNAARFEQEIKQGAMLEYATVFGYLYGSPRAPVELALNAGRDVVFDIDWQGVEQIKRSPLAKHCLSIFILPPSIAELHRRLRQRAKDSPSVIRDRMQKSGQEISHWQDYDYVVVNHDLETTFKTIMMIINTARSATKQQIGLVDFVQKLYDETNDLYL